MLRITIELLPFGSEAKKKHLGTVEIWNDATGDKAKGNYKFRLSRRGQPKSTWKTGELKGFPRKRLGAYDLLLRVLTAALGERNAPRARARAHAVAREATKALRVRITRSAYPSFWYSGSIGQTFEVVETPTIPDKFSVKEDVDRPDQNETVRLIPKSDCEVVKE